MTIRIVRRKGEKRLKPVQVLYPDVNGNRRSKQFQTRREAEQWVLRLSAELLDGTHVADRETVTVEKAAAIWLHSLETTGLERSTREAYNSHVRRYIVPMIGRTKLSQLTVPRTQAFVAEMVGMGVSYPMRRTVLGTLSLLLTDAMASGLCARNPVRDLKRMKRRPEDKRKIKLQVGVDIPSPADIRLIIAALEGRWRPILLTAIFTGLRSSELRAVRWSDIDLQGRTLHVRQRVDRYGEFGPTKSEAGTRSIPLPPIVVNTLREWKVKCIRSNLDLVFPSKSGGITAHQDLIEFGLKPALVRAGLARYVTDKDGEPVVNKRGKKTVTGKYTGLHALRHFFASWCINRKVDGGLELPAKTVQTRLGHGTIAQTLDTYGHLFPSSDDHAALEAGERSLLGV